MSSRILVAGVGNLFFSDDGFGPEVVRRLAVDGTPLPEHVTVVDYGIRGCTWPTTCSTGTTPW